MVHIGQQGIAIIRRVEYPAPSTLSNQMDMSTAMAPGSGRVHDEQTMAATFQRDMRVSISRLGYQKQDDGES